VAEDNSSSLVAALAEQGFHRAGERLIAPNGTLWLSLPMLDTTLHSGLRLEAERRLRRSLRQRKSYRSSYDWQCAVEDVECLLVALDSLPADRTEELVGLLRAS
jgi:hypothetical protein